MRLIDLRQFYESTYQVAGDTTPDQFIPCRSGRIMAATSRYLAVLTDSSEAADRFRDLGFARVLPACSGPVVLFPSFHFVEVAPVARPKRVKKTEFFR